MSRQELPILSLSLPQDERLDMSPAEEACEALPEKSQAGEWVERSSNKEVWYRITFTFFFNLTFLYNIDKQSAPSFVLDKMTEEEDDAYDFSTDYV